MTKRVSLSKQEKDRLARKVREWITTEPKHQGNVYYDVIHEIVEGVDYSVLVSIPEDADYTLYDEDGRILISTHAEPDEDAVDSIAQGGDVNPSFVQITGSHN